MELDEDSYLTARKNVETNGMGDQVTLVLQSKESPGIFDTLLEGTSKTYDFCLCNPPFYDESNSEVKNRTGCRPAPKNARTGAPVELSCDGGEFKFIQKIIEGSLKYKTRIRVFTSMIGIKNDLIALVKELKRLGVTNYTETEFCQGRTTRWGLALYLRTVPCIKSTFVKDPALFYVPEVNPGAIPAKETLIKEALINLFKDFEIELVPIKQIPNEITWRFKAYRVSWTNSRRRRREQQRSRVNVEDNPEEELEPCSKKSKPDLGVPILVGDIYLNTIENGHTLQIFYLDGIQGKDACQQILQVIINKFNKLFE